MKIGNLIMLLETM